MVEFPALGSDDRITKARQILRENVYREVYVHDGKRKLLGYIDITDVLRVTATKSDVTIDGFLKEITPVLPGDSMGTVLAIIKKNKTDSVPVVDEHSFLLGGVLLIRALPCRYHHAAASWFSMRFHDQGRCHLFGRRHHSADPYAYHRQRVFRISGNKEKEGRGDDLPARSPERREMARLIRNRDNS